jgi:DNA polymerase-1
MAHRLVIIDGHSVLYRMYHERSRSALRTRDGKRSGAFYGFCASFRSYQRQFPHASFALTFDSGWCWRNDMVPNYKHRQEKTPLEDFEGQLEAVKQFFTALGYGIFCYAHLEADDLVGVVATRWLNECDHNRVMIISSDRDFFQLVTERCLVYDARQKRFFGPSEVQAATGVAPAHFLAYRALLGDPADNLPGLRGYGKVKSATYASTLNTHALHLSSEAYERVALNIRLMALPRLVTDLPVLPRVGLELLTYLQYWVRVWMDETHTPLTTHAPEKAQAILDAYDVVSFTVNDFLH